VRQDHDVVESLPQNRPDVAVGDRPAVRAGLSARHEGTPEPLALPEEVCSVKKTVVVVILELSEGRADAALTPYLDPSGVALLDPL
jgi:hypothetical protein